MALQLPHTNKWNYSTIDNDGNKIYYSYKGIGYSHLFGIIEYLDND